MRSRTRVAAAFAVLVVGVIGWLWASSRGGDPGLPPSTLLDAGPRGADPLSAVPQGALLLATVDVQSLRHTALGERLIGRGRLVGGLGRVSDVCGSDPMAGVD